MRILLLSAMLGASLLLLGACQNHPKDTQADFNSKTHREYNPESGKFEQSPPWGNQSNKSETQ